MNHFDIRVYRLYMKGYNFRDIAKIVKKRSLSAKRILLIVARVDMISEIEEGKVIIIVPSIINYINK